MSRILSPFIPMPTLFCAFLVLFSNALSAQSFNLWSPVDESELNKESQNRQIFPDKYQTFHLDIKGMRTFLEEAPLRFSPEADNVKLTIELPMPDGSTKQFLIEETHVLHPDLGKKYPEIRSFSGKGLNDPSAWIALDVTLRGFHAMVHSSQHSDVFIDPYSSADQDYYQVYYKKDFTVKSGEPFSCGVEANSTPSLVSANAENAAGDCQLRTYRLALACTGEYAQFHGGTKPLVLSAMVTSMARVNGVYLTDVGIFMVIIPNNEAIIFLNASSDPYSNGNGGAMLGQNQITCNNIIGAANYDIGHVFSTGGGGIAALNSPCGNNSKARGVTGQSNPIGDPFDIDYVAHEMGHQYGANHTQNNSCNRNNSTAMEPGSASTIMGYAGICSPNVQNNSDAYFHAISIQEMVSFTQNGNGNSCAVKDNLGNANPTVAVDGSKTIPIGTPFSLKATGSDPNGDAITYCWEQMNPQTAPMPPLSSNTSGPAFRSLTPTASDTRYFPNQTAVLNNTTPTWEVLPMVDRSMNFRVTARDNNGDVGCTDEGNLSVTFSESAGPFKVLHPNTPITWDVGSMATVEWDVAGTNAGPVGCSNVNILLSTDGGITYPIPLASAVPNNGSSTVLVPNFPGTTNRVKIVCADNIFYDISDTEFTIQVTTMPTFIMQVGPPSQDVCSDAFNVTYVIDIEPVAGFNNAIEFSASGPSGLSYSFSTNNVFPTGPIILTVTGIGNVTSGSFTIDIAAVSASAVQTGSVILNINQGAPSPTVLSTPIDGQTEVGITPILDWEDQANSSNYSVEVATNPSFGASIVSNGIVGASNYTPGGLAPTTVYYWRVVGNNLCGSGSHSEIYSFQTGSNFCDNYSAGDVPVEISDGGGSTIQSTINVPDAFTLKDVNVTASISHSYVGDLSATLTGPLGQQVELFDRPGFPNTDYGCDGNDLHVTFDDEATATDIDLEGTCNAATTFAISGTFQPIGTLDDYDGLSSQGIWKLSIMDAVNDDGGQLVEWNVELCSTANTDDTPSLTNNILNVNQNSAAPITESVLQATSPGNAPSELSYTMTSLPQFGGLKNGSSTLGIGSNFTQADINNGLISYQNNSIGEISDAFDFEVLTTNGGWNPNNTFLIHIILPNSLAGSVAIIQNISCSGAADGSIEVNATGGTGPYQYSLDGTIFINNNIFEGLSEGSYMPVIKDNDGNTFTANSINLTAPIAISGSTSVLENIITVSASGGTGALQYSIDGVNFQSSDVFMNLPNGNYTITVMDANACTILLMATVDVAAVAVAVTSTTDNSCFGEDQGSITVEATGGLDPYMYSIDGVTFLTNNSFNGLLAGSYTITVQDNMGETSQTGSITIEQPTEISASASATGNDVTVAAAGGTGDLEYSIDGINFQSSEIFNDLANGTYTITIIDENQCETTTEVTVDVVALSLAVTDVLPITCTDENDGSILVEGVGGTPPYQYSLDNSTYTNDNIFTGLSAGTYVVFIQDANGTVNNTGDIVIDNPDSVSATANITDNTATINAAGGTGDYSYSIDGINFQSSNEFLNLANGDYTATIEDENNCPTIVEFNINVTSLTVAVTNTNNNSCFLEENGSITVAGSGGIPEYEYSIDGTNFQTSTTFTGLAAGSYIITVMDSDGATTTSSPITITEPDPLLGTTTIVQDEVTINLTGGTEPYLYSLDFASFQSSNVFTGLSNGTYLILAIDAFECSFESEIIIAVNSLEVSLVAVSDVECANENNGSITVAGSGGSMPFMFSIDGTNFQSSPTFDGLSAGTYTVTFQDADGLATTSDPVTLTEPSPIAGSLAVATNNITVNANGGTGELSYSIDGINFQTSNIFAELSNGTYMIYVVDENDCVYILSGIVDVDALAVTVVNVEQPACWNETGAITAAAAGGTAPYAYSIDGINFQTSPTFTGLVSGNYTITVKDAEDNTEIIVAPPIIAPNPIAGSGTINENDLSVAAAGGTGTLMYSIDGINFQTSNQFNDLPNGDYVVYVIDGENCQFSFEVNVDFAGLAVAVVSSSDIDCFGFSTGQIVVMGSGGTAPYHYSLNGGTFQLSSTFTGLNAGSYTITIEDALGNTTMTNLINILEPDQLDANGTSMGSSITVSANGGVTPYSYSIDNINFQSSNTFEDLPNGIYNVYIIDANECNSVFTIEIQNAPLAATGINVTDASCFNGIDGSFEVVATGGAMPYTYSIDGINFQTSGIFYNLISNSYSPIVQDANGDQFSLAPIQVNQPTALSVDLVVTENDLVVNATGGTGAYQYRIDEQNFQSSNTFNDLPNDTYIVTLVDENNCTLISQITITWTSTSDISNQLSAAVFPNPNKGTFQVQLDGVEIAEGSLQVWNILGQQVYSENINISTGQLFNKTIRLENMAAGSYYLVVKDDVQLGQVGFVVVK